MWTGHRGTGKRGEGGGARPWPTHSHLATSRRALLTEPGSLSGLSLQKHSVSASCVPGTVLGTRETAWNKAGKNAEGVGEGCEADGLGPLSQEGSSHLPPVLVHSSC